MTDQEKLDDLRKKKNHVNYLIRKISRKPESELKAKDIKDVQKYTRQAERLKAQMAKLRDKIKKQQVTSAYATVVRRSNLTSIDRENLLYRNYYNTDWLDGHEYLTKMSVVQDWQASHPGGSKRQCALDTGMSHHTIDKWWL